MFRFSGKLFYFINPLRNIMTVNNYEMLKLTRRVRRVTTFLTSKAYRPIRKNNCTRYALYAGLLSSLGLQKEEEQEDPVVHTIKLAILSMQREELDKSEQLLHLALKMAQERSDGQAETYIYDVLANLAFQKEDFSKAEKLFVEVMKRLLANGTLQDDNAIVEISLKLAAMYGKLSQDEKAVEGFNFCIDAQQRKLSVMKVVDGSEMTETEVNTLVLWAMSIDWYARYLLSKGQFVLAENNFEKALEVSERVNGPKGEQTLVLMNDIGTVATLRKDFDKAINVLQEVIDRGQASPDLPAFYCNLGATYLRKGDHGLAHTSCSEALKLANKMKHQEAAADAKGCLDELLHLKKK